MKGISGVKVAKGSAARIVLAAALAATLAGGVAAQTVADDEMEVQTQALDIPGDVTIFGRQNPNIRKPTAVVNGEIITQTDIDHRVALVAAASGNRMADDERDRLKLQVLRNLIDETLEIQEAAANGIKVDKGEIEQNYERVASNFKRTPAEFDQFLREQQSSPASIKRQIEGEIAWSRLLRRNIQPFVNVSEDEVQATIKRMNESKGTEEYRLGEIYLSSTPDNAAQVSANAANIAEQISKGQSFPSFARSYSEASTAAVGGDLGWVRPAQLPAELAAAAATLQVNQVAGPIQVAGGFSIIWMMDKRKVLTVDPRDAVLSLKQMSIAYAPGTTAEQAKTRAEAFGRQTQAIRGCGAANDVARQLGADVVDNDGVVVRNLPAQLQTILLDLQVGQSTPPFGSLTDGVRVLVLCGREDPQQADAPSADAIRSQMEEAQVNKRARTKLRDLRRDAVIDYN